MTHPFPHIEASPSFLADVNAFFEESILVPEFASRVECEVSAQLWPWPQANVFHAEVVAAMLAAQACQREAVGLYGPKMLEVKWNAGFSELPKVTYSLGVHGAYEFALCLVAMCSSKGKQRSAAESLLAYLKLNYPLPGAGLFHADDIG